jgi:hypothetical protein
MLQILSLKLPIMPLEVWPNKLYLFHPKRKLLSLFLLTSMNITSRHSILVSVVHRSSRI